MPPLHRILRPHAPRLLRRRATPALLVLAVLGSPSAAAAAPQLDLERLTAPEAEAMMERGELTSVELTRAYLDRIEALNKSGPGLNAVTQYNAQALEDAARLDRMRARGEVLSPAHGLPILLKDLIDVKGMYTSAGNFSLRNSYPQSDSGVAEKLRERGLVILGKTGLSEYANFFGRQPSGFANLTGQVLNGIDADQNPSGSSSGTGAAAAAGLSALTIGTETSGSIISPSRTQGIVGLRPTVGLVPGVGIAPISASQDTAGPMDRTVSDAAYTLTAIAGDDPESSYAGVFGPGIDDDLIVPPAPEELPDYLSALDLDFAKGKRIGWNGDDDPSVLAAKAALEDAGAILVERPVIDVGPQPGSVLTYEAKRDINRYYRNLGPLAPIKSLSEEIAVNEQESAQALKFGHATHEAAEAIDLAPDSPDSIEYRANLVQGKLHARAGIDRMLENDTPDDPSDDFVAILGRVGTNGARAGYPQITIPMGYGEADRRAEYVYLYASAYEERDLLGLGYVVEQGTKLRRPSSEVNPSMYRCADTIPAPPEADRGSCNPRYEETIAAAGSGAGVDFDLESASVADLQSRMTSGSLTAEALTRAYLARIAKANAQGPAIQAVRSLSPTAIADAAALDAERATSGPRGPLHGIPVLLDDLIDVEGLPTTGGSVGLQGSMPQQDAALVTSLRAAGAVILGKTNVTELGGVMDDEMPDGYSALGGQVLLPSDTDKTPGGSAAGSAAATATGMAALTIGLETGADAAQLITPASRAGVVGLKPTVGRVPRSGILVAAPSQDSPGTLTRTVQDAAAQLQVVAGTSTDDEATQEAPEPADYLAALAPTALSGVRIGVVDADPEGDTSGAYVAALPRFTAAGATTATVTTDAPENLPPSIVPQTLAASVDDYLDGVDGAAGSLAGIIARNQAAPGLALKYRQRGLSGAAAAGGASDDDVAASRAAARAAVDALLDAGTPDDPSDDLGAVAVPDDDPLVELADRAGYPMLTVPAGYGKDRAGRNPVGIVLVGSAFDEASLLGYGYAFEQAAAVRVAPSITNPSMWRCVSGSAFFTAAFCHPGSLQYTSPFPAAPAVPAPHVRQVIGTTAIAGVGGLALVLGTDLGAVSSVTVGGSPAWSTPIGDGALLVLLPPRPQGAAALGLSSPGGTTTAGTVDYVRLLPWLWRW